MVLQSVCKQTVKPDQVIIADDGSGPETARTVKEILALSGLEWCHVRHQDKGVRQSRIKNFAIKHSRFPYLVLVDQDVVLHPCFLADHLSMAERGVFLQGKRVLLPDYYSKKTVSNGPFIPPKFWIGGLGNRKNLLRSPLIGRMFSRSKRFETSLRGCNLSLFKKDALEVDGFDETFDESWGREDSDICYRLFHSGIRVKTLWFMALQYHLRHKVVANWDRGRLDREIQRNRGEKRIKALKGISRLTSEGEIIGASNGF